MSFPLTALPVLILAWSAMCFSASAAIIGTNVPPQPLTSERIAALPDAQRDVWTDYVRRSELLRRADQSVLQVEMVQRGLTDSLPAPAGNSTDSVPNGRQADWYAGAEARRIADIVVSFQTPAGGWSKNIDLSNQTREPGQGFSPESGSRLVGTNDHDLPDRQRWSYVGTIDNGATTTQLRFLAKVIAAGESDTEYPRSFERGVDYLLAAQNPNGGWPQVWPLQGGYHDAITYNDGAMLNVLRLLQGVAAGTNEFKFVPREVRMRAAESVTRGIRCILATQVIVGGRRTVWCQQHDALTLQPASARNYEMPSLCSSESAGILNFLMELPGPDSNTVAAVLGAAAWFEQTKLRDVAFRKVDNEGRTLVPAPGSAPLWARFYEVGSDRPIFGDRDKTIHDAVDGISRERRDGYAWFTDDPGSALRKYQKWDAAR